MLYRRLGRTDLSVSTLSLGTMTFGEQLTEAEGFDQLDLALENGINLFDTAELYPIPSKAETRRRTEQIIGNWMKARGNRDRCIIATKVVGRTESTSFRRDGSPVRLTGAQITEACERSLQSLRTDVIDLYQVHWPDRNVSGFGNNPMVYTPPEPAEDEVEIEETLECLDGLVKAGKVRHIGVSNESPWGVMRYLALSEQKGLERIASIQNAYSLINRTFETGLAEVSMREDVGLLIYSALAWGYLDGKYVGGTIPAGSRRGILGDNPRYHKPGIPAAVDAYLAVAREHGVNPAQMALSFAASRPFAASVVLGCSSTAQLQQCLTALDDAPMSQALEDALNRVQMLHGNPAP